MKDRTVASVPHRNLWRMGAAHAVIAAAFVLPTVTHGQWTVTNLHPQQSNNGSIASGSHGASQVGHVVMTGLQPGASLWTGTAASWVNLAPTGAIRSEALAVEGGVQVGYMATATSGDQAGLWTGSAASWISLNPPGATDSRANAISAGRQGGFAVIGGQLRAGLWSGTAESWMDMHRPGAMQSSITGIGGDQQVGAALIGFDSHASLWTGTPASWVDLNPVGAASSFASGVNSGQQVGSAYFGNAFHAGLWTGTAASWVDLNPEGSVESLAFAADRGRQVGYANVGGRSRASVWHGTAASWVDLSPFAPPEMSNTGAYGISSDALNTYVVGYGLNRLTGAVEALMWTLPICSAPVITIHPVNQSRCPGGPVVFSVAAAGTAPPFSYQWRKGGAAIPTEGPGGNSSAASPMLMLASIAPADVDSYDCVVSSAGGCGSVTSRTATLTICRADINCSGSVSVQDLFDFLTLYFANNPGADFNGIGGVTVDDIFDFLAAYFAGCP